MNWKSLKDYGIKLVAWVIVAAVGALAYRYLGVPKSDPGPLPLPQQAKAADLPVEAEPLYFCGRVESVTDGLVTKPWPQRRIMWTVDTSASPLPSEQVLEAFKVAWASWAASVDIEPVYTPTATTANVVSKFGDYDGSGKVLAWSELADGTMTVKHQLYDRAEKWGVFAGGGSGANIDLVRVAAHEIGHVIGLVHDQGKGNALMDPVYSKTIRLPTEQDVGRALALGYKPAVKTDPSPAPGPLTISFPVEAKADAVADALRKAGFKVEMPK